MIPRNSNLNNNPKSNQPTITLFNNLRPSKGNLNPIGISNIKSKLSIVNEDFAKFNQARKSKIKSFSTNFDAEVKNEPLLSKIKTSESNFNLMTQDTEEKVNFCETQNTLVKSILKQSKFKTKRKLTDRLSFTKKEIENFVYEYSKENLKRNNKNVVFQNLNNLTEKEVNDMSEASELYEEFTILNEKLTKIMSVNYL